MLHGVLQELLLLSTLSMTDFVLPTIYVVDAYGSNSGLLDDG